jgi:hypothetical protein
MGIRRKRRAGRRRSQLKSLQKSQQKRRRRSQRGSKKRCRKRRMSYFCAPRSQRAVSSQKERWRSWREGKSWSPPYQSRTKRSGSKIIKQQTTL